MCGSGVMIVSSIEFDNPVLLYLPESSRETDNRKMDCTQLVTSQDSRANHLAARKAPSGTLQWFNEYA